MTPPNFLNQVHGMQDYFLNIISLPSLQLYFLPLLPQHIKLFTGYTRVLTQKRTHVMVLQASLSLLHVLLALSGPLGKLILLRENLA